nr:RNA-directed DNA polymerase, eukaryota, reverse transcriptase zinc-binding domain protein [Tanacetum cinerariifolium]
MLQIDIIHDVVETSGYRYGVLRSFPKAYKPIVNHFEDFLGTTKPVIPMKSKIFTNTLSMEEAKNMAKEVSEDEIKDVVFEIDGDKALGLDGFSSGFFKKAWDVIGKDFCSAVKEFFISGKLLGEINATLIAIIPQ